MSRPWSGNPSHSRAHPGACAAFEEALHLHVDRELGPAEEARLEAHVSGCPGCQAQTRLLEQLSSTLKGWDARQPVASAAPARVRHAVLARVAEEGARLQQQVRTRRLLQIAQAAGVLMAIAVAAAFGSTQDASESEAATSRMAGSSEGQVDGGTVASLLVERAPLPQGERPRLTLSPEPHSREPGSVHGSTEWAAHPLPQLAPAVEAPPYAQEIHPLMAQLERELLRRRRFEAITARPAITVTFPWTQGRAPAAGHQAMLSPFHMTPEGVEYLESTGLSQKFDLWWAQASARPSSTEPLEAQAETLSTRVVGAVLPLAPLSRPEFFARAGVRQWSAKRPGEAVLELRPILVSDLGENGLRSGPAAVQAALDPLVAERDGLLRLAISGQDDASVVAIVRGTRLPIYLPAGHLLTGGGVDRVLLRSSWLAASPEGETPHVLACMAVGHDPARSESGDTVRLSPWIAGPLLRAMLAAGASPAQVLEVAFLLVKNVLGGSLDRWDAWSLRRLYERPGMARLQSVHAGLIDWAQARGFVVTGPTPRSGLIGIETTDAGGAAGRDLLLRLYMGYTLEAALDGSWLASLSTAAETAGSGGPATGPTASLAEVVERLQTASDLLREQVADGSVLLLRGSVDLAREASVQGAPAGSRLVLQALEQQGRLRAASALHLPAELVGSLQSAGPASPPATDAR